MDMYFKLLPSKPKASIFINGIDNDNPEQIRI